MAGKAWVGIGNMQGCLGFLLIINSQSAGRGGFVEANLHSLAYHGKAAV